MQAWKPEIVVYKNNLRGLMGFGIKDLWISFEMFVRFSLHLVGR
jgi:hypothetical protein